MPNRIVRARLIAEARQFKSEMRSAGRAVDDVDDSIDRVNRNKIRVDVGSGVARKVANFRTRLLLSLAPLAPAASGLLLGIPAAANAAIGPLGAVIVAAQGVGDALSAAADQDVEKFQVAMRKLAPEARGFVNELLAARPALGGLRRETQQGMFRELRGEVTQLASVYIPSLSRSLPGLAASVGQVGSEFVTWATQPAVVASIDRQVKALSQSTRTLGDVGVDTLDLWVMLGDAGSGFADDFLRSLGRIVSGLRDWVAEGRRTGELDAVFDATGASVDELIDTVVVLGGIIGDVFANPATISSVTAMLGALNGLLGIVKILTGAFSSLPGGVQQAVLTLGLLAYGGTKLIGVFGRMTTAIERGTAGLDRFGPSAMRASTALGHTARFARGAMTAIVGLQIVGAVGSAFGDAAADVDRMSSAVRRFGDDGAKTGELTRVFDKDLGRLADTFRFVKNLGGTRGAQNASAIEQLVGASGFSFSVSKRMEEIKALDASLAQLTSSGNGRAAAEMFAELERQAGKAGISHERLVDLFPQYTTAAEQSAAASNVAGTVMARQETNARLLAGSLADAAREAGSLRAAWDSLNGTALASDQAMLAAREAVDRVKESFRENGSAIQGSSAAALANRVAIREAAQAATAAYDAKLAETSSYEQAEDAYRASIAPLRNVIAAMLGSKAAADRLLASLSILPPVKDIRVRAILGPSIDEVNRLRTAVAQLKNKQITVTTYLRTIGITRGVPTGRAAYSDTLGPRRWGGITEHAQTGLLREAQVFGAGPTRYAFAEPATGGEAFVPRKGDYGRSMNILSRAAGWYGSEVVPRGAGSVSAPQITVAPQVRVFVGDREILDIVRVEVDSGLAAVGRSLRHGRTGRGG